MTEKEAPKIFSKNNPSNSENYEFQLIPEITKSLRTYPFIIRLIITLSLLQGLSSPNTSQAEENGNQNTESSEFILPKLSNNNLLKIQRIIEKEYGNSLNPIILDVGNKRFKTEQDLNLFLLKEFNKTEIFENTELNNIFYDSLSKILIKKIKRTKGINTGTKKKRSKKKSSKKKTDQRLLFDHFEKGHIPKIIIKSIDNNTYSGQLQITISVKPANKLKRIEYLINIEDILDKAILQHQNPETLVQNILAELKKEKSGLFD